MAHLKFDLSKLEKLNDPGRLETLDPTVMWAALGNPHPRTVVDIGAGTGLFAAKFIELAPDAEVFAADIEPAMVEWMRKNRPEVKDGRLVPILADESRVPVDDGIADLVVMINLHHELADASESYGEALRLLASHGQLLVVDWAPGESPKGPPQHVRADAQDAMQVIEAAGFSEATVHEGLPYAWLITAVRP